MGKRIERIQIPDVDIWSALFDRASKPFPDSQVIYECPYTGRSYTYAQVRATTIQIGTGLQHHWQWQKNDVLAIFSPNCIDTPAITWGTHWAGGIVSPANPAYTVRELAHHLRDSGAKALVTQKALLGVALKAAKEVGLERSRVVLMGDERDEELMHFEKLLGRGVEGKKVTVDPRRDLAYLVYSSGTTGLPKGVMLTHRNTVSNLYQVPLLAGIPTIVMPAFDLAKFCTIIQKHRITYTYVAPPIVVHLAKNPDVQKYDLSSLRMITSGAAPLTKDLIYQVKERLGTEVKQAYGLSETSPVTHMQSKWDHGLGSNGPALPNQIVKFMSPDGTQLPPGKEGELWISGPNVFAGYHNNASATSDCMTSDGFFKTGDIGYEDADGNMFITDRVKELIKFKGFQVAPAELEGLLMGNDKVNDVAVVGVYDERIASEIPLAFVVPADGVPKNEESAKEIVDWLQEKVANHKRLRGGVRFVDVVPKSASGKILRRVLKDLLAKEESGGQVKAKL